MAVNCKAINCHQSYSNAWLLMCKCYAYVLDRQLCIGEALHMNLGHIKRRASQGFRRPQLPKWSYLRHLLAVMGTSTLCSETRLHNECRLRTPGEIVLALCECYYHANNKLTFSPGEKLPLQFFFFALVYEITGSFFQPWKYHQGAV